MIKYRLDRWGDIEKTKIERETAKFIVLANGMREAKSGSWSSWHDSFAVAKARCVADKEKEIARLNRALDRAKVKLEKAKELKP